MHALRDPLTIDFSEIPFIDDLISAEQPAITWICPPNAPRAAPELLFPEFANDEIRADHMRERLTLRGIGLAILQSVLLSGDSLVGTSSHVYRLDPLVPTWVDRYLEKDAIWHWGDRSIGEKTERLIEDPAVLLTHFNSGVYGHWLLEGLPKLLLLKRIQMQLPKFCIVLPQALGAMWPIGSGL